MNFDVYRVDIRYFMPHGDGNVFAIRQLNHLTQDAPTQARASVQLRGYKFGRYQRRDHVLDRSRGTVAARNEVDRDAFRGRRLHLRR